MTTPTGPPLRPPTGPTDPQDLLTGLGRSWLWPLGFGLLTLVAGVIMLSWPEETVQVVGIIIGLQLLVAGVARFVTAFTHDDAHLGSRILYVILALLAIVAGVLCLRHQLQAVGFIALIVGLYWLISGVVTVFVAVSHRDLPGRGLAIFFGLLGIVAGVVVLAYPVESAIALARLLGLWLLVLGIFEAGIAIALRDAARH
ncbi:HdeD family acid-resistance protein [Kitasatospora camelliae]|uniref:DUF308 domain-containing protein n=1 Tax=Kitasatospora camelliae TaxID=3156397 RepID=A0AAU8JRT8_9ACTN